MTSTQTVTPYTVSPIQFIQNDFGTSSIKYKRPNPKMKKITTYFYLQEEQRSWDTICEYFCYKTKYICIIYKSLNVPWRFTEG